MPVISNEYGTIVYVPIDEGTSYKNYVLTFDVNWSSTSGLAGCGVIFHSEQNLEIGEQYQFFTMRLSGLPLWDVELWNYGKWQSTTTGEPKVNSAINLDNGSTNHYVLVVKDDLLTAYANDKRLSNVIITKLEQGRIAFYAIQESGMTSCIYENAWVWVLEEE